MSSPAVKPHVDLSVIIPSHNTASLLADCIQSILGKTWKYNLEVIVVDNGSRDGTAALIRERFPSVKLNELPDNRGYGAACNVGAAQALGGVLLFLNSDVRVLDGSLDVVVEGFHQYPNLGAAACHELSPTGETVLGCRSHHTLRSGISFLSGYRLFRQEGARYQVAGWDREDDRWVDNVSGFAWAIRRKVFDQIGRFDEKLFFYFEEPDIARRLQQTSYPIRYLADARIIHVNAASTMAMFGLFGKRWQWVKSFVYWRKKHGLTPSSTLDRVVLFPFLVVWWLGHRLKRFAQKADT